MSGLSCICRTKAFALIRNAASPPGQPKKVPNQTESGTLLRRKKQPLQQGRPPPQPPSIYQVERAIGAGSFRDADPSDLDRKKSLFDGILPISSGKFEGKVEKQLRETGEWLTTNTESKFQSSGNVILLVVLKWILPVWILCLLLATQVINLPWTSPFLDDLFM